MTFSSINACLSLQSSSSDNPENRGGEDIKRGGGYRRGQWNKYPPSEWHDDYKAYLMRSNGSLSSNTIDAYFKAGRRRVWTAAAKIGRTYPNTLQELL